MELTRSRSRSEPPRVSQPQQGRSVLPSGVPAPGQTSRPNLGSRGLKLVSEVAKGKGSMVQGGRSSASQALSGPLGNESRRREDNCEGNKLPRAGYFTGAGTSLEFIKCHFARNADLNHKVITASVKFDATPGTHTIFLQAPTVKNKQGALRFQFGTIFLMTRVETFACDVDGELDACQLPHVVFNIPRILHATTVINGHAYSGLPVDETLGHRDLPGFGARAITELAATYQVIGTCDVAPTRVGIRIFGYVVGKELYQEAIEPVCASGGDGCP